MTGIVAEAAIAGSGWAKTDEAARLAPVYFRNRRRDILHLEFIEFSFLIPIEQALFWLPGGRDLLQEQPGPLGLLLAELGEKVDLRGRSLQSFVSGFHKVPEYFFDILVLAEFTERKCLVVSLDASAASRPSR